MDGWTLAVFIIAVYVGYRAALWYGRDRGPCRHQLELVRYNQRSGERWYVCTMCGHEEKD